MAVEGWLGNWGQGGGSGRRLFGDRKRFRFRRVKIEVAHARSLECVFVLCWSVFQWGRGAEWAEDVSQSWCGDKTGMRGWGCEPHLSVL